MTASVGQPEMDYNSGDSSVRVCGTCAGLEEPPVQRSSISGRGRGGGVGLME